jgi:hypothetical protein
MSRLICWFLSTWFFFFNFADEPSAYGFCALLR